PTSHRALHSFPTRRSSDLDGPPTRHEKGTPSAEQRNDTNGVAAWQRARNRSMNSPEVTALFVKRVEAAKSLRRRSSMSGWSGSKDRKSTRLNSSHVKISYA